MKAQAGGPLGAKIRNWNDCPASTPFPRWLPERRNDKYTKGHSSGLRLQIADQIPHPHVQSIGNGLERSQRHALPAGFNPVQMHAVQTGQLRQFVLGDGLLPTNRFDPCADGFLNVLQRLQPRAYAALKHPA